MFPVDFLYSKEHEWVKLDGDHAIVGIISHAQGELGEIVYVECPEVGVEFENGEEFGTVESVKAVAEMFMPISGEVVAINEVLEDEPELLNQDPHQGGWIVKIRIKDKEQLSTLMNSEQYSAFVAEEAK